MPSGSFCTDNYFLAYRQQGTETKDNIIAAHFRCDC